MCMCVYTCGRKPEKSQIQREKTHVRVVPELEQVGSYVGKRTGGMFSDHLQVFFSHLPHWRAAPLKQSRVVEVPLWKGHAKMQNVKSDFNDEPSMKKTCHDKKKF